MQKSNKVITFIIFLFQFSVYSSENQKIIAENNSSSKKEEKIEYKQDNLLDVVPVESLQKIISDYTVDWELYKTIDAKANQISSLDFSPTGKYLASGYIDGKIKIWSSIAGNLIRDFDALGRSNTIGNLAFSQPDGKYLAAADPAWYFNRTKIFDIKTGKELHEILNYTQPVYSKNGEYLAAVACDNIRIFNTNDYSIIKTMPDIVKAESLIFAPNNKYLAYFISGSYSSAIVILNIDTSEKKYLSTASSNDIARSLSFSNDSKYIASGSYGGKVSVWEVETTKLIHEVFLVRNNVSHTFVKFSENGKFLAGAADNILKIWDFKSRNLLKEIEEKQGTINNLLFLPNNDLVYGLYSYGGHSIVKIWRYEGIE